jgi:hypothetical protein
MYLYARRARLAPGNTAASMTWATNITEKATQIGGLPISLFSQVLSPEVGVLSWSTFVPDLQTLETAMDKLNVDAGFMSMIDEGAKFDAGSGADDVLAQVVYGEPDPNRQVEYVSVVQAVCASGAVMKGIELGVEIAQRAEKAMGEQTMFLTAETGNYGGVSWITGYSDIKAFESAQKNLAADAKFGEYVDKAAHGVYAEEPALTQQRIYRRIV